MTYNPRQFVVLLTCVTSILVFCFVRLNTKLAYLPDALGDDGLYIILARHIADGDWLGPFNVFTLAKGPGYPIFLAASHFTGLPSTLSEALLFAACLAVFSFGIAKSSRSPVLGAFVFVLTILHPSFLAERLSRENVYVAQMFFILGAVMLALLPDSRRHLIWATAAGLMLSWFWLTREEGIWLVPGLGILICYAILKHLRSPAHLKNTLTSLGALVGLFLLGHAAVNTANLVTYGKFQGVDIKERNFQSALSSLQSVSDGTQIPYVPVSRSTRAFIYEVSPTFALLRDSFDPPNGKTTDYGCKYYSWTCGDIAGGWFIWHLKGSAAGAGAYASPHAAAEFFAKIASEVESGCKDGRLHCSSNPISFMPRTSAEQFLTLPNALWKSVMYILNTSEMRIPAVSTGTAEQRASGLELLNYPLVLLDPPATISRSETIADITRDALGRFYQIGLQLLLPLSAALSLLIVANSIRKKTLSNDVVITGALWVLLLSRLSLISLIEISSFPAISKWYLLPATYLSVPVVLLTCFTCYRQWNPTIR